MDKKQASDEAHRRFADPQSDFVSWVNLWQHLKEQQKELSASQFRKKCRDEYLAYLRVREWQDLYTQLKQAVHDLKWRLNETPANYDALHRAQIGRASCRERVYVLV